MGKSATQIAHYYNYYNESVQRDISTVHSKSFREKKKEATDHQISRDQSGKLNSQLVTNK